MSANYRRYLCSHLVSLKTAAGHSIVNLEEIWQSGAVLELEQSVAQAARVEIRSGRAFFAGEVVKAEKHQFGWRVEIAFSPMTPWNPEEFQPEHLLEL